MNCGLHQVQQPKIRARLNELASTVQCEMKAEKFLKSDQHITVTDNLEEDSRFLRVFLFNLGN